MIGLMPVLVLRTAGVMTDSFLVLLPALVYTPVLTTVPVDEQATIETRTLLLTMQ